MSENQIISDVGASDDSAGDLLASANEVLDANDKNKVGTDKTLALEKGQLTVEGPFYNTSDSLLAITGGTGEYAGAQGEMALSQRAPYGALHETSRR